MTGFPLRYNKQGKNLWVVLVGIGLGIDGYKFFKSDKKSAKANNSSFM
jgi:hypothetical protein